MPADLGDVLTSPPAASPALPQPPPISRISLFQPCGPSGCSAQQETLLWESNDLLFDSDRKFQLSVTAPAAGECSGESGGCGSVVIKRGRRGRRKAAAGKALAEYVKVWVEKKVGSGIPLRDCSLPFLCNAPRMVECRMCRKYINPGEELVCSVRDCPVTLHENCAMRNFGFIGGTAFKCPQHVCFTCKQKANWRCIRCMMAAHTKCSPWPDDVRHLDGEHKRAICWRHPTDWRLEMENSVPTDDIKEVFHRLPLPYVIEEFRIDSLLRDVMENKAEPTPYIHIKRNVYLVKKKRDHANVGIGCTSCNASSTCSEECECKGQSVSCSKACHCSELCTNRPFRKEKKIKIVKTQFCGWGVVALEAIKKEEFIIEYIGEVINDAQCEQRLWDMKYRGDQNFYMCEIRKDFTIDATFKGNASRFLNHSCDPNCKLEKWHVDGETRVGVFASQAIIAGEPLTYDYRFVHFGPMVKCFCGASNCHGYLGNKKKIKKTVISCWGCKRRRTTVVSLPPS